MKELDEEIAYLNLTKFPPSVFQRSKLQKALEKSIETDKLKQHHLKKETFEYYLK